MKATLTGRQAKKIIEIFEGAPSEQVQAILASGLLTTLRDANIAKINCDDFRRLCGLGSPTIISIGPTFPITVDHALSLQEMITAGGYDYADPDITEDHFPRDEKEGKEKVDLEFLYFKKWMSSDEVLAELKRLGYRPATLSELLAFGYTPAYKDEQRKYLIVALGSVWQRRCGNRFVPCLWYSVGECSLGLDWFGGGWHEGCRFAAVRESI